MLHLQGRRCRGAFATGIVVTAFAFQLAAQCTPQWLGDGLPGTDSSVVAVATWDPDGPGPLPMQVVLGGNFQNAGPIAAGRLATWDTTTSVWGSLGDANGVVSALTTLPTGELVAAGSFTQIGGVAAANIARWNGTTWQPFGAGLPLGPVSALTVTANGSLVAGGSFTLGNVGGVAIWNGSTWAPLGGGLPGSQSALAMATLANGDLVVGGSFSSAGGTPATNLARWDGAQWFAMGNPNGQVRGVAEVPGGSVVVAGYFTAIGGVNAARVASWNGATWSAMGSGANGLLEAVAVLPSGAVVAGGNGAFGSTTLASVARWNGSAWLGLTGFTAAVDALVALPNGDLVAGAAYGGDYVRRWSATGGWQPLYNVAPGPRPVHILTKANGELVASGKFVSAGALVPGVAHWTGSAWSLLGGPFPGIVWSLVEAPNGDLVVGTDAGVSRWNGTTWQTLGSLLQILTVAVRPNGDVFANTSAGVGRWNGASWVPSATVGFSPNPFGSGYVSNLVSLPNGDLVASGEFDSINGQPAANLARFDGVSWSPMPGLAQVATLVVLANGDLLAGGQFDFAVGNPQVLNSIARWNGTGWSPIGGGVTYTLAITHPGIVYSLQELPDGDLLVGGYFDHAGGTALSWLARWNGSSWSSFGSGPNGSVQSLALAPWGELFAGGNFTAVGSLPAQQHAHCLSPCSATANVIGSGCAGSAGGSALVVMQRPWLGGQLHTRATDLPAQRVPVAVLGFTQVNVPLSSLFAQALPGCTGYVSPDYLELRPLGGGDADFTATLPDTPALVGMSLLHQMLVFEVTGGTLVAVNGTDAWAFTVGDL